MSFCFGWIVLHVFWLLVVLQFSFSNLSWIGWRKKEIDDLCECFGSCVFWIVEGYWSVLVYFKVDKSCKMKIWKFEFSIYGVSKFPYINLKNWIFLILLDFWTLGKFCNFQKCLIGMNGGEFVMTIWNGVDIQKIRKLKIPNTWSTKFPYINSKNWKFLIPKIWKILKC